MNKKAVLKAAMDVGARYSHKKFYHESKVVMEWATRNSKEMPEDIKIALWEYTAYCMTVGARIKRNKYIMIGVIAGTLLGSYLVVDKLNKKGKKDANPTRSISDAKKNN